MGSFGASSGDEPPETLARPLKMLPLIHFASLMGMCSLTMHESIVKEASGDVVQY